MSHKSYLIFSSTLCAFSTDTTPTYHRTRSFTVYPRIFSDLLLLFRLLYSLSIHTPAPSLSSPDPEDLPILTYHKAEDSQTVSVGRRTPSTGILCAFTSSQRIIPVLTPSESLSQCSPRRQEAPKHCSFHKTISTLQDK